MALRIIKIPENPILTEKRRRAAAYARVSTGSEEQQTSYAAQVEYYTDYIKSRAELDFVRVYTDEGITGTSITHREGFKRMIADALDGEIDLIIAKSVSRFARNTVDSLSAIRLLKEHGVECYFERENISTFDNRGELLLTIMSAIAQEEARSISLNCTWGQRKRFADGKVTVPFSRFLGYDRGEDGSLIINKKEAELVRRIYALFLQGKTPYAIAKKLTDEGIPTPGGKTVWSKKVVKSILTNEKYKGDALLQKVYTVDFLTKKKKLNNGEVPQYYVEGSQEAIVPSEIYEMVQEEFDRRREIKEKNGAEIFREKIVCGCCGEFFLPKVWYSTNNYRKVIWQCKNKFEKDCECGSTHLVEPEIRLIFVKSFNELPKKRKKEPLTEFNEKLWREKVEKITVFDKENITVTFKGGAEIRVDIEQKSALDRG